MSIRAQITTRSGPPGTKNAQRVVHGQWRLGGQQVPRDMVTTLQDCLDAARGVARDGMVTEVAVLVYPELPISESQMSDAT